MNRNLFFIVLLVVIIIAGAAAAQQGVGPGGGPRFAGRGFVGAAFGNGNCNGGRGVDVARVATFAGNVKSFTGGPGAGRPTLVLTTSEGEKTFIVAPYRIVMDAGVQFVPGMALTISAAPNANDEWVVVTFRDDAGKEVVLRDVATGTPAGGRGGRCRMQQQ